MSYNIGKDNPMYGSHRAGKDAFWYGKKRTKETIEKMRKANLGKKFSKKHRQALSEAHKGKLPKAHFKKGHAPTSGCFKAGKLHPLYSKRGKEVPAWKGGISKLPYAFDFDKELKMLIRKRDKHICQLCQKRKIGKNLCVHHIDYDKQNSNPKNLVTLCRSCHSKTNSGRKIWTNFFNRKLKLRKVC